MMHERKHQYILAIEDSPDDFEVFRRSLQKVAPEARLRQCRDGDEAMQLLLAAREPGGGGLPDLILLDLNLPGTDGRDVLRTIKSNEGLKSIPVIVFSTSNNDRDIIACYADGANAYLTKPTGSETFTEIAMILNKFWLEYACLPHPSPYLHGHRI